MQDQTETLESGENGPAQVDEIQVGQRQPSRANGQFVHFSGSQPLDGFTIKRGVGIGGFGEVYYATSEAGKDVALKHIQRNLDVELRGVKQCLNLKHTNLVSLFDIKYDDSGQAWVVMEYISGESLQDVIERNPNGMPLEQVERWFQEIASGVAYLHDHGIVHRDLKPGNIFWDEGVVKIGDYGLSKFISCSRRSGQTESVGTFHYMAPEIGRGRYGKEIDIYALGIVLYEMITGRVPYNGESSQEIIMKHLTAEPALDDIPIAYRPAINGALDKDPEKRLNSVHELLRLLPMFDDSGAAFDERKVGSKSALGAAPRASNKTGDDDVIAAEAIGSAKPNKSTDEPIARAVSEVWANLVKTWNSAKIGPLTRAIIAVGAVFLLIVNGPWLMSFAMTFGLVYVVYLVIRAIVLANSGPRKPRPERPRQFAKAEPRPTTPYKPRRRRRRHWHECAHEMLQARTIRERLVETTGSLLLAAIVSAVLCVVLLVIANDGLESSFFGWAPVYVWMMLSSTAGAWTVLLISKFWEHGQGDAALQRFSMLVVGMLVGGICFGIASVLQLEPTYFLVQSDQVSRHLPDFLYSRHQGSGEPRLLGYLGYFGGLFVALRWWKLADPLRPSRLSVWSTALCVLWAIALFQFLPFPRGFMIAATTALAVQMAAPYLPRGERQRLQRLAQES